jgi:signal transduction histidine kinase
MRERVDVLEGRLTIRSTIGGGTSVEAIVPASVEHLQELLVQS